MSDKVTTAAFKIREATINDVSAIAALHVETFNETHGMHPDGPTYQLREYQWQKAFIEKDETWFCFVIEDENGKLVGFAKGLPYHDDPEFSGTLNKIYILKRYHKLGLGRQLICKVAREFIHRGIFSMLLFGEATNPSNTFYERMGGEKLITKRGEFHGGYGWRDLQKLVHHCPAD
jgi:L-amino acid N-acyltransferase YncA